jgi:poly(3-hydroxybutyrate) depolymerase
LAATSGIVRAAGHVAAPQNGVLHRSSAASLTAKTTPGQQTIQTRDGTIFIPAGLQPGRTYPLVVAFAYNASPNIPLSVWRSQAQQNDWIIYASKEFNNDVLHAGLPTSNVVAAKIKAHVDAVVASLPIDPTRIVFTGMSGGANFADLMNLRYPGYGAAVIINSGEIPMQLFRRTPTPGFDTFPSAGDFGASRRVAVFLCSPSDSQFFGITQANAKTMQRLGWDTLFIPFKGGHWNAPLATYQQAIAWIQSRPGWTASA